MKVVTGIVLLILCLFITVFAGGWAGAEDQMGYVLRHNWWGVDYYWVHDSNKWGEVMCNGCTTEQREECEESWT
jgi:hypothetical protein